MISGFCVGEPWNTLAVCYGLGRTLSASYDIWNNHPEKVFGVASIWAAAYPNTHEAVLSALLNACEWIDRAENRLEVCEILSQGRYVNAPQEILAKSMLGTFQFSSNGEPVKRPDFNVFHRYKANFPWRSHALWFLTQMARWGQLRDPVDFKRIAHQVYRPEILRQAAEHRGMQLPPADYKLEGTHTGGWTLIRENGVLQMGADSFFDGLSFNPHDPIAYLEQFDIKQMPFGLEALGALNGTPSLDTLNAAEQDRVIEEVNQ